MPARFRIHLRRLLPGLALLVLLAIPAQAQAVRTWTLDIKAHPTVFKAGTEVDVPLYLVENRAPDHDPQSYFSQFPAGIRMLSFNLGSSHSRFVSFTPIDAFDGRGNNVPSAEGLFDVYKNRVHDADGHSALYVNMISTKGVPATPDNSGITGRTEALVGTLRIAVGPAIDVGDDRKIVLDVVVHDDPSAGSPLIDMWRTVPDANGDNWSMSNVGIMATREIRFFTDGTEIEGIAPGDGSQPPVTPPGDPAPSPDSVALPGTATPAPVARTPQQAVAQVLAASAGALGKAGIAGLLGGAQRVAFDAPGAGKVKVEVVRAKASTAAVRRRKGAKSSVVASGSRTVTAPGSTSIAIKATRKGRAFLKRVDRSTRVTVRTTFVVAGGKPVKASRAITLKKTRG